MQQQLLSLQHYISALCSVLARVAGTQDGRAGAAGSTPAPTPGQQGQQQAAAAALQALQDRLRSLSVAGGAGHNAADERGSAGLPADGSAPGAAPRQAASSSSSHAAAGAAASSPTIPAAAKTASCSPSTSKLTGPAHSSVAAAGASASPRSYAALKGLPAAQAIDAIHKRLAGLRSAQQGAAACAHRADVPGLPFFCSSCHSYVTEVTSVPSMYDLLFASGAALGSSGTPTLPAGSLAAAACCRWRRRCSSEAETGMTGSSRGGSKPEVSQAVALVLESPQCWGLERRMQVWGLKHSMAAYMVD
jgi:hypothetical protein